MGPLSRFLVLLGFACAGGASCPGTATADEVLANVDLSGKMAVVTGGDTGVGYAITSALARRGVTVVIGNSNETNGQTAAQEISAATGGEVRAIPLDLASLDSVRAFAGQFLSDYGQKLHFLVNSADIEGPSEETADGFESVFQAVYLGHFLLTELLLPALRRNSPSRVVNVAGVGTDPHKEACFMAGWSKDCFRDWTYIPPPVVPWREFQHELPTGPMTLHSGSNGVAKFLGIQHVAALARREAASGVEAFSADAGLVSNSHSEEADPMHPALQFLCGKQVHPDPALPENPCPFSPDQGAASIAFCLSGQASSNGAHYHRIMACQTSPVTMHGFNETMQLELYERSLGWSGLTRTNVEL